MGLVGEFHDSCRHVSAVSEDFLVSLVSRTDALLSSSQRTPYLSYQYQLGKWETVTAYTHVLVFDIAALPALKLIEINELPALKSLEINET